MVTQVTAKRHTLLSSHADVMKRQQSIATFKSNASTA